MYVICDMAARSLNVYTSSASLKTWISFTGRQIFYDDIRSPVILKHTGVCMFTAQHFWTNFYPNRFSQSDFHWSPQYTLSLKSVKWAQRRQRDRRKKYNEINRRFSRQYKSNSSVVVREQSGPKFLDVLNRIDMRKTHFFKFKISPIGIYTVFFVVVQFLNSCRKFLFLKLF